MYVADAPVEWTTAAEPASSALQEASSLFGFSKNVALYFPRLSVRAPDGSTRVGFPASPLVAGILAKVDVQKGIWKAPANETLAGVIATSPDLNNVQNELLNPQAINCIRQFEGRGIRLWGTRTRSGVEGGSSEFRYINVVRLIHHIEIGLDQGLKAVVFEPNTPVLWAKVRHCISDMLTLLWRNGALQGAKPEQAFFVHCGLGASMTQEDVDNRRLLVTIGIAAIKPAEFIILQFATSSA
jgi:phage tail sheath protein FI